MISKYVRLGLASLFLLFALAGVLLVAAVEYVPSVQKSVELPKCAFQQTTGFYCPGCGATRALRRAVRGDFIGALRYNALLTIIAPVLAYFCALEIYDDFRGTRPSRASSKFLALACMILYVAFFVLRNIPLDAFDLLRPPL